MSTARTQKGGWAKRELLPKGPGGRILCRHCGQEVPPRRSTFCSAECVHEWRLRTDPNYLREQVFRRDKGYCALCHADTVRVYSWLRRLRGPVKAKALAEWGLKGMTRRSLWDADHVLPVVEGGGECDLSNLRTLCLKCHRKVTAQLRERRLRAIACASQVVAPPQLEPEPAVQP
jgi:5-methylcytosine-specific restriction endonuclease McrA